MMMVLVIMAIIRLTQKKMMTMMVLICRAGWSCKEQWRKETSVGQGGLNQGLQVVFLGNGYVLVFVNLKQFWYPS